MTSLPPLVLRSPKIFYGLAVIFFLLSVGLTQMEINTTMGGYDSSAVVRVAFLRTLYQAALEAGYLAGTGVMLHILLAIWQDVALRRNDGPQP